MADGGGRWRNLRKYLVTGLIIWVPITVTLFVLRLLVNVVDQTLVLLPGPLRPEALLGFRVPGLGVVLAAALLLATGMLFSNFIGRRLVAISEAQLGRIPFVGAIYRGSKQVTETLLAPGSKSFRKVVLIPWPHAGARSVAFVTGNGPEEVRATTSEDMVSAFVPTTPNPTSGFLVMVPRRDAVELAMSVEEAFRLIVSLGVVLPAWPPSPARDGGADP
ncbi:MAG TPA: DUF502 domain-containing protein [Anaeromyxobacteraceae bacterium]|nr:DUF502 domain-containing protein [Anaeromyxobacteraceae bacterium]